ncbi:7751_t:CDS:10, partial [Acaulospora colombiana]
KEDLTLEELLDEDELLQECKAHNNKLIEYLRNPSILSQLLNYIIRDDLEENMRYKYVVQLELNFQNSILAVVDNVDLLSSFWQFLDRASPLNPLQASYFTKVNVVFLQKKMSEMAKFIQSIPNVVKKMLNHMETPTIMDLLLKLISVEEYPEGAGVHSTAAQVLIEIINISQSSNPEQGGVGPNALSRDLISDYSEEAILSLPSHQQQHPVVDLSDMLRVLANRIGDFKALLENPKSVIDTTIGKMVPLGFERFKICELFAELLHCSNMRLLNVVRPEISTNGFYELKHVDNYSQPNRDVSSENVQETGGPQNEMETPNKGSPQKDSIQSTGSNPEPSTSSVSSPILMEIVENVQTPPSLEYAANSNNTNGPTSPQLPVFTDGQLTKRITKAQRLNDYEVQFYLQLYSEQPKGVRLGYMGHLTFIAEEVVKLLDSYAVEIGEKVTEYIEAEDWQEYVSKTLRETKERNQAHLGGQRPSNHDSASPSREESEDDDEEDDNPIETVADGDMASDQFARYLCQQITNDLPDKFCSSDESDDDEEAWMGDEYDRDEFEMRGHFGSTNMLEGDSFESQRSSLGDDLAVDSDEDRKQLLTVADWSSADFQSGFRASSNTTQTSDSLVSDQPYAVANFVSADQQSTTSLSIPVLTSKETNVQQTLAILKTTEDGRSPDVEGSMETSIHITSSLDNSHAQDSSDRSDEGNLTDFAILDKMGISGSSDDKVQDDSRDVVDNGNSTVEKA